MKRGEFFSQIWQSCHGALPSGAKVAVSGGGISGLHLAYALARKKFAVTVFDPQRFGGVRIPLMHACHTLKRRSPLWEKAAAFSRLWYKENAVAGDAIKQRENDFGIFFNIHTRQYLRRMKMELIQFGVTFMNEEMGTEQSTKFALHCLATGAATTVLAAAQKITGRESYFSRHGVPATAALTASEGGKITNYIEMRHHAGYIHRNTETRESAIALAKELHTTGRHALFEGVRLTTRDRFPAIGFLPLPQLKSYAAFYQKYADLNYAASALASQSLFLFSAMGYHAMTYAPYLAAKVAAQLSGEGNDDENLVCALTPARFLPRIDNA